MMDMSAAALPARYGHASAADESHPRFAEYRSYRSAMSCLLVDSLDFRDWLRSVERDEADQAEMTHPQFPEFQAWMRSTKAGGRKCPGGQGFPQNFRYWLTGARW